LKACVFVINVCHSIFGAIPVLGYHPEGTYEFKEDLNGDSDSAWRNPGNDGISSSDAARQKLMHFSST
jgi:hypothetical protein